MNLLKFLPPEGAHAVAKWAMARRLLEPGRLINGPIRLFGKKIDNPVCLAAGFDKTGELAGYIRGYGFGWVEVGSVTRFGGPGNPRPRLFRTENRGLLNRMGLNGDAAEVVAARINGVNSSAFAINIAKTHDPAIMGDKAIEDVCASYRLLCHLGIYTVLNISCVNTVEGRTFERPDALKALLGALPKVSDRRPLLVKFGLHDRLWELDELVSVCLDHGVEGFVSTNTFEITHPRYGKGGLSGPALLNRNVPQVKHLVETGKVVIACGGIEGGEDAKIYMDAGAVAVQAYCGFVRGPNAGLRFARTVNEQLYLAGVAADPYFGKR